MHDGPTFPAHLRTSSLTTLPDVLEHRKAEPQGFAETADSWRQYPSRCRVQHLLNAAREQRILVVEMCVEGRTADVGTFENLVDHDCGIVPFVNQRHECLAQSPLGPAHACVLYG